MKELVNPAGTGSQTGYSPDEAWKKNGRLVILFMEMNSSKRRVVELPAIEVRFR